MKFVDVALFALIVAVASSSTLMSVRNNRVGDINTLGVKGDIELHTHDEYHILSVIVAILNQPVDANDGAAQAQQPKITPEMAERVKSFLSTKH